MSALFVLFPISSAASGPIRAVVVLDASIEASEQASMTIKGQTADLPALIRIVKEDGVPKEIKSIEQRFLQVGEGEDIVFFPDFSDESRVMLYTSMPTIRTTLIRTVDAPKETLESRFEIAAVMIRGIVTAMLSGKEIGVRVPDSKEVANPPEPLIPASRQPCPKTSSDSKSVKKAPSKPQPQTPLHILSVQDSYGIGLVSEDIRPVHFIRPSLRVHWKTLEIFVAYRFSLPFRKENDALAADLFPHPVELGFDVSFHKNRLFFRLGASLIADPVSMKVTAKEELLSGIKSTVDLRLSVSPFVSMDWFFSERMYLFMSISADVYIYQTAYEIAEPGGSTSEFLNLWKTSPVFQLGFGFDFL